MHTMHCIVLFLNLSLVSQASPVVSLATTHDSSCIFRCKGKLPIPQLYSPHQVNKIPGSALLEIPQDITLTEYINALTAKVLSLVYLITKDLFSIDKSIFCLNLASCLHFRLALKQNRTQLRFRFTPPLKFPAWPGGEAAL